MQVKDTPVVNWQDTALVARGACVDAVRWARDYQTFAEAWAACERGDWMLWLIGRTIAAPTESAERRRLVRVACQCARLALPHVRAGETRPLAAIEMAERWARQEDGVTLAMVRTADAIAAATNAAVATATNAAAAYAAAAAAYAAHADADAADAVAATAADAASAASAADAAARSLTLRACADLVRAEYRAEEVWAC